MGASRRRADHLKVMSWIKIGGVEQMVTDYSRDSEMTTVITDKNVIVLRNDEEVELA